MAIINWKAKYKSKEEAILGILDLIQKTPGTAGLDGKVGISVFNSMITITPVKKKQQYEA